MYSQHREGTALARDGAQPASLPACPLPSAGKLSRGLRCGRIARLLVTMRRSGGVTAAAVCVSARPVGDGERVHDGGASS